MTDHHATLGVTRDATLEDIQAAYRLRARLLHPDRHQGAGDDVVREAERSMKALNEAYSVLKAQTKRAPGAQAGGTAPPRTPPRAEPSGPPETPKGEQLSTLHRYLMTRSIPMDRIVSHLVAVADESIKHPGNGLDPEELAVDLIGRVCSKIEAAAVAVDAGVLLSIRGDRSIVLWEAFGRAAVEIHRTARRDKSAWSAADHQLDLARVAQQALKPHVHEATQKRLRAVPGRFRSYGDPGDAKERGQRSSESTPAGTSKGSGFLYGFFCTLLALALLGASVAFLYHLAS